MASYNNDYLKNGRERSILELSKAATEEIGKRGSCKKKLSSLSSLKGCRQKKGDSSTKMAMVEFFSMDDNKVLQNAGVKFVAIIEPTSIVGHNGKDNRPLETDITSEHNDNGSKQLAEQSRPHFSYKIVSRLKEYIITRIYVERAGIIAETTKRKKKTVTMGCAEILTDRNGSVKAWMTDRCKYCVWQKVRQ